MTDNARAMVLASFAADALALGAHWIYDTAKIDREYGMIDQLLDPIENSYHATKKKGDFTHYGDQALLLLTHLAENGEFSLTEFARRWEQRFSHSYTGYIDQATRQTLAALEAGNPPEDCGSNSSDLGGPARIAPLIFWYRNDPDQLMSTARQQTRFTHRGAGIAATTDFLVHTTLKVLAGIPPAQAIEEVIDDGVAEMDLDMRLRKSLDSSGQDSRSVIASFGQMCSTSAALPGAVHLVLSYQDDMREALIRNVMAGGDSAARGMVVGMILGAYQGMDGLDQSWLADMRATATIEYCLDRGQR